MKPLTIEQVEFLAFDLFDNERLLTDPVASSMQWEAQQLYKFLTTGEKPVVEFIHFDLVDEGSAPVECDHSNSVNVGDDEYMKWFCPDCELPKWHNEAMEYESGLLYGEPF